MPGESGVEDLADGFYQYDFRNIPRTVGLCSDRQCPCPETRIPRGSGYLYISEVAVAAMMLAKSGGGPIIIAGPILVCRQAAELRGLDLVVAAADARRWWEKGKVPLRPTPLSPRE